MNRRHHFKMSNVDNTNLENFRDAYSRRVVSWFISLNLCGCDTNQYALFLPCVSIWSVCVFLTSRNLTKLLGHSKYWNTESQWRGSNVLFLLDPWVSRAEIDYLELCIYAADREPTRIFPNLSNVFPDGCAIQNSSRAFGSPISRLAVLIRVDGIK